VYFARSQLSSIPIATMFFAAAIAAAPPVAAAANVAPAPAPEPLSLRDAIARAVKGNVDLRREGITLRTTEAGIVTALGQFDFVLSGDGSFTRRISPTITTAGLLTGRTNIYNFDLTLARALESGGQLSFTVSPDLVGGTYTPSATLNFTQPLLRNFGREVTEANLRKARMSRDQEVWNRAARAANVLRDTITAYWELAYQLGDLEIRRSAVALAEEQLRTTEAQVQIGKMGELQAAAVRRAISDDQQEVETSQQQLIGRSLDLLRLLGIPVPPRFAGLRTTDSVATDPHQVDADDETGRALKASPALKALQEGIALSDVDLRTAIASLKPQLDLNASVGRVARSPELSDALQQLSNPSLTQASVGLVFSMPVQNRAARGAEETARAARDNATLTAEDMELSIRDSAARLAAQVRSASSRIDLAKESVKWAQQNLEAERARFQVGQSTNNDVLMRQQELKQAQISGVRAAVDLLEADVALSALTGDILDTYGVTLRGY
jgi:outer membrane protein TolC